VIPEHERTPGAVITILLLTTLGIGSGYAQGTRNDRDGDGVINAEDRCPDVPGPVSNNGCPVDSDGDGLTGDGGDCDFTGLDLTGPESKHSPSRWVFFRWAARRVFEVRARAL
jgi:hypothetical protein